MSAKNKPLPLARLFLIVILLLSGVGFFVFMSASLGIAGTDLSDFIKVISKQLIILGVSLLILLIVANIPYSIFRRYALLILFSSIVLTLLVFIPGLGVKSGGALRWINIAGFSFQPAEMLKLGLVIYYAAWLTKMKNKTDTLKFGVIPLLILIFLSAGILISQPDTGTFLIIVTALLSMYVGAGAKWKHLCLIGLIGLVGLVGLVASKPYLQSRIDTFLNPNADTLGQSYQLNQSLIAIGSGGLFGRGFGQSLQKFNFLPEPNGDSIFAVSAEEFGFVGSIILLILFLTLALIGLKIASNTTDQFGRLMVIGLVILIISQSFTNIAAMLGLIPLTGIPLILVSQGGSALLFAGLAFGLILSVTNKKRNLFKS